MMKVLFMASTHNHIQEQISGKEKHKDWYGKQVQN